MADQILHLLKVVDVVDMNREPLIYNALTCLLRFVEPFRFSQKR